MTIAEVLVAGSILLFVSILLIAIYTGSYSAFRRGTTRLSVNQRSREVVRRLTPIIMSAVAPLPIDGAVYLPESGLSGDVLELNTANDILAEHTPINPRAPTHFSYRIYLDPPRDLNDPNAMNPENSEPKDDGTLFLQPLDFETKAPTSVAPTVIAHRVFSVEFDHSSLSTVRVNVTTRDLVRTASGQEESLLVNRSRVIGIPYYSSAR